MTHMKNKKQKCINSPVPFSPYRYYSSSSFYRLSAFCHNQADLKRFMHMPQPLRNYSLNLRPGVDDES
jgi:hypothetical protein